MNKRITILTGAGISKESGLSTFRDCATGLWNQVSIKDVATPEGFDTNPDLVHDFYNARRSEVIKAQPNAAHLALADFEKAWRAQKRGLFQVITQNIDDLHERAGSSPKPIDCLIHLHGSIFKARCKCNAVFDWRIDLGTDSQCRQCKRTHCLRPDVVWFGEQPRKLSAVRAALRKSHVFIAIGTSGSVYPAADFVKDALLAGAHTVELNLEPSEHSEAFDETHYGPATEVVPAYLTQLLDSI